MNNYFRIIHRYLGYFLAGIMLVYALSGTIMIFRETNFLKSDKKIERQLEPGLAANDLGKAIRARDLKITRTEDDIMFFSNGSYNVKSGLVSYTVKELPTLINKLTKLHKASTDQPLYWLNVFFGCSLLFFSISAFWMFRPNTDVFRKGLYFAAAGLLMTLLLIFL